MATVPITDMLVINVEVRARYSINVTTGTLVVGYATGTAINSMEFTAGSAEISAVDNSVLTFTLNGDTADITRI